MSENQSVPYAAIESIFDKPSYDKECDVKNHMLNVMSVCYITIRNNKNVTFEGCDSTVIYFYEDKLPNIIKKYHSMEKEFKQVIEEHHLKNPSKKLKGTSSEVLYSSIVNLGPEAN